MPVPAYIDLARGHYEVKTAGFPGPYEWEYRRLVRERYGVEINAVAGCGVRDDLMRYVHGYNSVTRPRIQARFGKDIFAECEAAAEAAGEHGKE